MGNLQKWPKNPFKKAWGLQTDGGLWEQAWIAILRRGSRNQKVRKVKGHATDEQVEAGTVKIEDKVGNDKSDDLAFQGVEDIHGIGLLKLANWTAKRQQKYGRFMAKVRKFIVGMTLLEKAERDKDKKVNKALLGYDPDVWVKSKGQLKKEKTDEHTYIQLDLPRLLLESISMRIARSSMATSTVSCKHDGGPIPSRKLREAVQHGWNYLHFLTLQSTDPPMPSMSKTNKPYQEQL